MNSKHASFTLSASQLLLHYPLSIIKTHSECTDLSLLHTLFPLPAPLSPIIPFTSFRFYSNTISSEAIPVTYTGFVSSIYIHFTVSLH